MVLLYPFTLLIFVMLLSYVAEKLGGFRLGKVRVVSFCLLYLSCTPLCANLSLALLKSLTDETYCHSGIDSAVILAGGMSRTAASSADWSALGPESISRTAFLASRLPALPLQSVVISGGSGNGIKEGRLMADLFSRLQPRQPPVITLDERAVNTRASAEFVHGLAADMNKVYYLVTSDWHMPRAQAIFAASQVKVCPLASGESYVPYGFPGWFIPQKSALAKFERVWHEFGGLLFLWWRSL
ncbi:YdcF family protein [Thalassomonas viridans]|uniref:YdcF family protein n=1 Tax=Thalassomonas viridans TaxID=137584 RepID=A0AAE9Z4C2_9GAMM|nr:YdcF family protein [Thalassomonas viridans]WDE05018.1 YdcF family protein [Thalassomonas viridans]